MTSDRLDILLVEDDPAHAELVVRGFAPVQNRFSLFVSESLAQARDYLQRHAAPALIISDWRLTDGDGLELLAGEQSVPVVLMTSQGNERIAVEAMKAGALDYVVKSEVSLAEMPHTAERALRVWQSNIQRRLAEDELRRRVRHLSVLGSIAGLAIECADEATLLDRTAAVLNDAVFPEHISIFLLDETEGVLRPAASYFIGRREELVLRLPLGKGITGQVALTGETRRVDDTLDDSDYVPWEVRSRSELCVPLRIGPRVVGVINVENRLPNAHSKDDERLLAIVANQVSTAVGRLRSAQALRDSEERFRRLSEASVEGIAIVQGSARIVDANSSLCRMSGYTLEELGRIHALDLWAPESRPAALENFTSSRTAPIELLGLRKDGSTLPLEVEARTVSRDGVALRILAVRDVSERKRLESELRQAQKLQVLGQLAGGIAHDFNNLLTVILGYSDLVLSILPEGSDSLQPEVQQIRDAGKRAAALTQQLLAFSRRQTLELQIVDLNEIIRNLLKMLQRLIGEDIELTPALAADLERVKVDRVQMEQVIMNLSTNARDAMKDGGTLAITTRNVRVRDADALVDQGLAPGAHVTLEVSDTGVGMPPDVLLHIFEPFFTTKELGKGTGLGLATVHGIVKQSGGHIHVESAPGHGTTFRIFLPAMRELALELEAARSFANDRPAGSETILLVEDEPAVRRLACDVLRMQGYNVLEASEQEALELGREYAGPIHLLLADVVMPTMNGRDLAQQLEQWRPSMKVLYVSGYADDVITRHGIALPNTEFLQKPFTPSTLSDKVRRVLHAEGAPI
ncbi:MAG: response regulator [Chloroflexi bacterium]|nr:response regulator [Chloroflexota bacterium]